MKPLRDTAVQPEPQPPRVSVLMAVFNTATYLNEALRSVSSQSFEDFELLVIDDGSTDGSTQVLNAYAAIEPRMKLTVRANLGLIATRNELLASATGELIAWMDSDDVSMPDRLALQVQSFDDDPELTCLGSAAQCIDPEGHALNVERFPLTHLEILDAQQKGGAMRFPSTMMRRATAVRIGHFREPFKIGEDFDFLLRLSEVGKMANLARPLYLYRQHLSSVCATLAPAWDAYRDRILELARQRRETGRDDLEDGHKIDIAVMAAPRRQHLASQVYVRWARFAQANGNRRLAWKYATASVIAQPTSLLAWKMAVKIALDMKPGE